MSYFRSFSCVVLLLLYVASLAVLRTSGLADERPVGPAKLVWCVTYHSISEKTTAWDRFTVSPDEFSADLDLLQQNGYESILPADLVSFVRDGTPLPDKPVMITFDDGYRDNYTLAYPLLKQRGMRAVVALVGELLDRDDASGDANRPMLTWKEARALLTDGVIELADHTYALHRDTPRHGCSMLPNEPSEDYSAALSADIGRNQDLIFEKTGFLPITFVYPYGDITRQSYPVLERLGFLVSFSTNRGANLVGRHQMQYLWAMRRNNRPHGISSEDFFRRLNMI